MENKLTSVERRQGDEIDLFQLVIALWKRKWTIVGITAMVVVLAAVYLVFAPKIYEAQVMIGEVKAADIAQLNVGKEQLGTYAQPVTSESAIVLFRAKLQSKSVASAYFKENIESVFREKGSLLPVNKLSESTFLTSLKLTTQDKSSTYFTVKYQYTDPVLATEWLNGYLRFVEQQTKKELVSSALHNKSQAVKEYESQMASLRVTYSRKLLDRVIMLEEAYRIAKKINVSMPVFTDSVGSSSLYESLLYMRGFEALNAEIEALKSRKLIDPFVPEIRPIQENVNYLDSVEYDTSTLNIISVDAWATHPARSVEPKKVLVLGLAAAIGGLLSLLVILVLWLFSKKN